MTNTSAVNPLIRLLLAIHQHAPCSLHTLARELQTSEPMIQQMIQALATRGYLERISGTCALPCHDCTLPQRCLTSGTTLWRISEKGLRVIRQHQEAVTASPEPFQSS